MFVYFKVRCTHVDDDSLTEVVVVGDWLEVRYAREL